MANYTQHYQLHQWVPEDDFLRTDFNTDFQKIDAALEAVRALAAGKADPGELDALERDINSVRSIANGRARAVKGTIIGTGTVPRTISVGFSPKIVYLVSGSYCDIVTENDLVDPDVILVSGGFQFLTGGYWANYAGNDCYYVAIGYGRLP